MKMINFLKNARKINEKYTKKNDKNFCAEFTIFVCISLFFVHFSNDFSRAFFNFFMCF